MTGSSSTYTGTKSYVSLKTQGGMQKGHISKSRQEYTHFHRTKRNVELNI